MHLAYLNRVENRPVDALAGRATILRLRPNHLQQADAVTFSEDRQHAAAIYHVDVELGTPLQGNFTVAQMARLQGQTTDHRWECGRIEAKYQKQRGEWMMESCSDLPQSAKRAKRTRRFVVTSTSASASSCTQFTAPPPPLE